jgi:phosphoribosylformimino-5-aminoimidazole carboxamide ribotide isomerase
MLVIPAIDIKGGKVVRLVQGKADQVTVYSDDPVEVARRWASFGVGLIHIVDLDGAFEGSLKNFDVVKKIVTAVNVKLELGGGIRDMETIKNVLNAGVDKVCMGTKALDDEFLNGVEKPLRRKIVVSIDAKGGVVYTKGWLNNTKIMAMDVIRKAESLGIVTVNYTDISRDGTLEGPNIKSLKALLGATNLDVVAGGGISSIDDVKALKALEENGLKGIIIGKALYENRIDLAEAIKICEG